MTIFALEIPLSDIVSELRRFTKINGEAWVYDKHKKACEKLFRDLQKGGAKVECILKKDGINSFALHIASEVLDDKNTKEAG